LHGKGWVIGIYGAYNFIGWRRKGVAVIGAIKDILKMSDYFDQELCFIYLPIFRQISDGGEYRL
jgi:hypothetical protein